MPIKKIEINGLNPDHPITKVIDGINHNLDAVIDAINAIEGGAGVVGETGAKGDKGDPGQQGIEGPAGKDGKDGIDGKDGKDGVDGRDGADGAVGATGPKGEQGIQGHMGPAGKDGLPGAQGPKGDTGAQGVQGLPGKDGTNGVDGVGITTATIVNGNLILTKTDGTTVNAGKVVTTSTTTATTATAGGPPVVGSAPNPFAPIVVTSPQGYKAANIDDGVELTLDTIAVQLATSGSRSLQMRVTSGTMNVNISGECFWANGSYGGNWGANYWTGNTLTTTYQQIFGWSFPWANDKGVYFVQDLTNRRFYRITLFIGPGYKKNTIIMERLV